MRFDLKRWLLLSLMTAAGAALCGSVMNEAAIAEEETGEKDAESKSVADEHLSATHKQSRILKPLHQGKPIELNTFCLDTEGNIVACVGSDSYNYVSNGDGSTEAKSTMQPKLVQFYSPNGELIRSVDVSFRPTAINQAPDKTFFVAGDGKVAHLSSSGEVLATADSPHIGDLKSFTERVAEGAKKQAEEMTETYRNQLKLITERIAKLREKPDAELTARDRQRLTTYESQQQMYQQVIEQFSTSSQASTQAVQRKMGITALAVTSKDIFLCCNAIEGYGYEVWRMTHEFSEPERVVEKLSGCCGQCDIQATDEHLVLAENTKFRVGLLDRDGNRQSDFGKGDRKGVDGFGSCCNPMNVRCCANGDILTAESSIGTIKRFSSNGRLLGVIGRAKIGGGCKHVALGFDEQRNRYYMMNVDKSHICVLVPNAEAPEITPDEALAKEARDGLGRKLVGEWSLDGQRPGKKKAADNSPLGSIIDGLFGTKNDASDSDSESSESAPGGSSDPYATTWFEFAADGKLKMFGGQFADGENSWEPVRQEGNTLIVSQLMENIQYYDYKIEFVSDDEATISLLYNDQVMSSNRYKRVRAEAKTSASESKPDGGSGQTTTDPAGNLPNVAKPASVVVPAASPSQENQ